MENYIDRTALIIDLQSRGYDQDFVLQNEGIFYVQQSELIAPDEFEISEAYCPLVKGSPSKSFVIYAINGIHFDLRGILVTSYACYKKGMSIHLWSKLAKNLK